MGFADAPTWVLESVRSNLLAGLDLVAASIADGTFHQVGPKGSAPPAQSGHLTMALLDGVDTVLAERGR